VPSHLVLLTDTQGLLTADPRIDETATLIEEVTAFDADLLQAAGTSRSGVGSGGMASKLAAAHMAAWSGVTTVIAPARSTHALRLAVQDTVGFGTTFHPRPGRLSAPQVLDRPLPSLVKGRSLLTTGLSRPLNTMGRSLLRVGVESHQGTFVDGDAVDVKNLQGETVAKGFGTCVGRVIRRGRRRGGAPRRPGPSPAAFNPAITLKKMTTSALTTQGAAVKRAAAELAQAPNETRQAVLTHVADRLLESEPSFLGSTRPTWRPITSRVRDEIV